MTFDACKKKWEVKQIIAKQKNPIIYTFKADWKEKSEKRRFIMVNKGKIAEKLRQMAFSCVHLVFL